MTKLKWRALADPAGGEFDGSGLLPQPDDLRVGGHGCLLRGRTEVGKLELPAVQRTDARFIGADNRCACCVNNRIKEAPDVPAYFLELLLKLALLAM